MIKNPENERSRFLVKRILSVLLCLAMLLTAFAVLAEDDARGGSKTPMEIL